MCANYVGLPMSASALTADIAVRFDNLIKYDCKIKALKVVPRVVPLISKISGVYCQTFITAHKSAKDNFLNCKTGKS